MLLQQRLRAYRKLLAVLILAELTWQVVREHAVHAAVLPGSHPLECLMPDFALACGGGECRQNRHARAEAVSPHYPQADKPAVEAEAPLPIAAPAAVHEAAPFDAAVHEPAPAEAKTVAGHAGEEVPIIGAPEVHDAAAAGDEGGALNPIPAHEHPTPGHESAAEEYNTASEGGDLEATAAPAHDAAEIEAIKEEVRQVIRLGFVGLLQYWGRGRAAPPRRRDRGHHGGGAAGSVLTVYYAFLQS